MLKLDKIDVYYGAIHALKTLSLEVNEGEIVTLIGANGAGKSTTLKTISGLIRPKTGDVLFNGESITAVPAQNIVKMGISQVPEGRRIFAKPIRNKRSTYRLTEEENEAITKAVGHQLAG
jgi:branched-chain amino acid transport system ATP-binding protein